MFRPGLPASKAALLGAAFLFGLSGCAALGRGEDLSAALAHAQQQGFAAGSIEAGGFRLATFARRSSGAGERLAVYIEGDGAAWPTPYHPPRDPTPRRPVALSLALVDPAPSVVYLGRPCQYLAAAALQQCDSAYWVERRFAPEVVAAYDAALDELKRRHGVRRLRLVGYSGGGVLAALLAARRTDVEVLVTVAAPLALGEWTAWHDASPLLGSLDPAVSEKPASGVRSVHFAGGRDTTVPVRIVERYVRDSGGVLDVVPDFDHECCWARDWRVLLGRASVKDAE